jgi:dienelactone hydrolase
MAPNLRGPGLLVLVVLTPLGCATPDRGPRPPSPPGEIAPYFKVPKEYRSAPDSTRSPLLFQDGTRVTRASEWPRRRAEIVSTWEGALGTWPSLLPAPSVEVLESTSREGVRQDRVRLGIGLDGETTLGFLLVPSGRGPFPAVLVVFYEAQSGAGLGTSGLDWGWQLAKRGFVTLSIGKPNSPFLAGEAVKARRGDYLGPEGQPLRLQPLSMLAYLAANAHTVLARRPDVRADRIGIIGHSFGGKWALFASALYEKFACAVWSDPGIVFDERDRSKQNAHGAVNYWSPGYLGSELGRVPDHERVDPYFSLPRQGRTGAYKTLVEGGHDLVELHALLAPRPFLVSGGSADLPERWTALRHAIEVNRLLGAEDRVAMTNREGHSPTERSNDQACRFFEWWLRDR